MLKDVCLCESLLNGIFKTVFSLAQLTLLISHQILLPTARPHSSRCKIPSSFRLPTLFLALLHLSIITKYPSPIFPQPSPTSLVSQPPCSLCLSFPFSSQSLPSPRSFDILNIRKSRSLIFSLLK